MTARLPALAAGLFGAVAIIGAAAAEPLAPLNAPANRSDDVTGSIVTPAVSKADPSLRVYCFNGAARDGLTQHRGWVCQQDTTARHDQ